MENGNPQTDPVGDAGCGSDPGNRKLLTSEPVVALTEIDRGLLQRCLASEPGAWKDFVDRFLGLLMHVVHHTAHSRSVPLKPEDVDDLCAEVFLTILADDYAVLRQFRGEASLAPYLTVVARRVVVREMSQRRMAEAMGHVAAHASSIQQAQAETGDSQRVEHSDEVESMLSNLSDQDARLLREYHMQGRSYAEIASTMGVPENSVGPMLSRARAQARERGAAT